MDKKAVVGPIYVDGKLIYPETVMDAVKDRDGTKLSDIIEKIKQLGVDEIEQLREYIQNAVIWDDSVEFLQDDVVIRDAETLGGKYTAADLDNLIDTWTKKLDETGTYIQELRKMIEELKNS